jgi:HTH-type transcriptional regulator/antitoxin HipB
MPRAVVRTPADLGALIRDRRLGVDLDQAELARRAGVSRLWINQVERGKPGASIGLVLRTLMVLGIELSADPMDKKPAHTTIPDIDTIVDAASDKPRQ